ncbi:penicillin-binding protein 1C [Limnospira maxima CS-328]|uniref:Penicillin-binding protein 1C n=1 Tax=Limnospira maxima CS-328 TaxID=513049 RepID=B5W978_LIMMA|nr:penicillin-binding protein 1C [Limnospira maxima]EDZ91914.1 penicillin-binding protein 1C [Limnospira maxima CS-328]MDC0837573.1 penicillin-binding protein 1C [Limnoraphis robusta]
MLKWPDVVILRRSRCVKVVAVMLLLVVLIRSIPYSIPIRAKDIRQNSVSMEFSDRQGLALGTILSQDQSHTAVVPLKEVSPYFIQAIIAAEDKRYYQHGAVDIIAIVRAVMEAIQAREIVSGASTITMQLARMLEPSPNTLPHKIREIWLSWRLFAGMNRDEILAAYINRIPMGGNLYGVEAAARTYFGIGASDLSLSQASVLAGLPNDPTDLNPYFNWEGLKQRQKYVLDRMVEDGYITPEKSDRAYRETLRIAPREQGIIAAPHFLFWVASQLSKAEITSPKIQTTLDRTLQQFVETQVRHVVTALGGQNVNHGAAIVINNHTGEVLAYVGSPDYFNWQNLGSNDGVQAWRQPGSTLKPFLYQLAIAQGIIRPNTILPDVPTYYPIPGAKLYAPVDYSETFLGPVRVRIALGNSLNIPAVRVLEKVGVGEFLSRLHQLGFTHLDREPEHYGLGLSLGSGEVSLWELAQAYLTFANRGKFTPLVTTIIPEIAPPCKQKCMQIDTATSWELIVNMLADSHARATAFGVDSVLNLPFPVAVKTGTSSDYRDTWTVGFTTDYTVATWVGNFDSQPMQNISGVMGAAPLWNQIMMYLHRNKKPDNFPPPEGLFELPICSHTGWKLTDDCGSGIVLEYFYPEDIKDYDNLSVTGELPAAYNEWLSQQESPHLSSGKLRIVLPQNNDYFLVTAGHDSPLELKVAGVDNQEIQWFINDNKIATTTSKSIFWQPEIGDFTLKVVTRENMSDRINFQVREAEVKPYRRGFSIGED